MSHEPKNSLNLISFQPDLEEAKYLSSQEYAQRHTVILSSDHRVIHKPDFNGISSNYVVKMGILFSLCHDTTHLLTLSESTKRGKQLEGVTSGQKGMCVAVVGI